MGCPKIPAKTLRASADGALWEGKRMRDHLQMPATPVTQAPCTHDHAVDASAAGELSRRNFLKSTTAGLVAGAIAGESVTGTALAAEVQRGRRILLKGGGVLSLDPNVGDFETADVLIEGAKIVEVRPNIQAAAAVIDASNIFVNAAVTTEIYTLSLHDVLTI